MEIVGLGSSRPARRPVLRRSKRALSAGVRPGLYYVAMPPEGVSVGRLNLSGARPQVGSGWTDDPHAVRRARTGSPRLHNRASRAIPPVLLLLRAHSSSPGEGEDGRLVSAVRGGPVRSQEYGAVWREARYRALTPAQAAFPTRAHPRMTCDTPVCPSGSVPGLSDACAVPQRQVPRSGRL